MMPHSYSLGVQLADLVCSNDRGGGAVHKFISANRNGNNTISSAANRGDGTNAADATKFFRLEYETFPPALLKSADARLQLEMLPLEFTYLP